MKQTILHYFLLPVLFLSFSGLVYAQEQPSSPPPPQIPKVMPNAGFDVIVMLNGDFIYGLVQEVGPVVVRYKRTDIPDGPIYSLNRYDIYAISYRNQLKEVLNPLDTTGWPAPWSRTVTPAERWKPYSRQHDGVLLQPPFHQNFSLSRQGVLRVGLGFFRGYSNVDDAGDYDSKAGFPAISVGYDFLFRPNLRLGAQVAWASRKFTRRQLNLYDSLITDATLKETAFAVDLYVRYMLTPRTATLRPYLMGGLGLHTSHIRSEQNVTFMENNNRMLQITSGRRVVNLGILARVGADYAVNDQIKIFGDAGFGPSVLQLGVSFSVQ